MGIFLGRDRPSRLKCIFTKCVLGLLKYIIHEKLGGDFSVGAHRGPKMIDFFRILRPPPSLAHYTLSALIHT